MCVSGIRKEGVTQAVHANGQAELSIKAGAVPDQAIRKRKVMPAQRANLIHNVALGEAESTLSNVPVTALYLRRGSPFRGALEGREFILIVTQEHQPATCQIGWGQQVTSEMIPGRWGIARDLGQGVVFGMIGWMIRKGVG
jgi:hypothetical protein